MSENTQYLIFVDLLGFEELAKEIAQDVVDPEKVRIELIETIENRLNNLGDHKIAYKTQVGGDSWVLVTDDYVKLINSISEILNHRTNYQKCRNIPLEIAVGVGAFDEWAVLKGREIIAQDETIGFLKTNIIGEYHKWYKENHGSSVKSTFILLTESMYNEMDHLNEKWWDNSPLEIKNESKNLCTYVADIDSVQKRANYLEFLEKIGIPNSKIYDMIDSLYVPPLEYDEIKNSLEKDRVVFITGTPEYGKTYTAVKLLWDYFCKGYTPEWIRGNEEIQRIELRSRLEDIESQLEPHHIFYFEDPFGKTKYECVESLEREIGNILHIINNSSDVYVIITSREEVFKEFKVSHLSSVEIEKFEKKLNIKKPSYDSERRKEILSNWAVLRKCKWLDHSELNDMVFSLIDYFLPTPLCIRDFCISTSETLDASELLNITLQKSEETKRSFARELSNMGEDKILFLSFPFVSDSFEVEYIEVTYAEIIHKLELGGAWSFDEVVKWFINDKVEISDKKIRFSHPSYSSALEYLFFEQEFGNKKKILEELLLKLYQDGEGFTYIPKMIVKHFTKLSDNIQGILFELSEHNDVSKYVAEAVREDFNKIPLENLKPLIFKLSEKDEAAEHISRLITNEFNNLPVDIRNLLFSLAEKDAASKYVVDSIIFNYKDLPSNIHNLLFSLLERDEVASDAILSILFNFKNLPENVQTMLLKLPKSEHDYIALASGIVFNFEKLPNNIQGILSELAENKTLKINIILSIMFDFNNCSKYLQSLFFKLIDDYEVAGELFVVLLDKFEELPEKVIDLIFEISSKKEYAFYVAYGIINSFEKLPQNVQELLFELIECDDVANLVLSKDYNKKLPENFLNQLIKSSEDGI